MIMELKYLKQERVLMIIGLGACIMALILLLYVIIDKGGTWLDLTNIFLVMLCNLVAIIGIRENQQKIDKIETELVKRKLDGR